VPPPDGSYWEDFRTGVLTKLMRDDIVTNTLVLEAGKPGCNDVPDPGDPETIVSRFWTDATIDQLTDYVNPEHWPELGSLYWKEMTALDGGPHWNDDGTGYTATFREVVDIPPAPITVYLDVRFTREPGRFALTEYWATRDPRWTNEDVDVDEGCVLATTATPGDDPNLPQFVYSTKLIRFRSPVLNQFTGLACDNGWVDLMIKMALPEGRRPSTSERKRATTSKGPLDQWADSFKELIDSTTAVSRRLVGKTRAGSTSAVIDDVLRLCDRSVDTFGLGMVAARDLLHQLAERPEQA
jgi:hypothetical protein